MNVDSTALVYSEMTDLGSGDGGALGRHGRCLVGAKWRPLVGFDMHHWLRLSCPSTTICSLADLFPSSLNTLSR